MIYPGPINGDRLQFELDYANVPPKERPDWPLPSFDSRDWAEAFCKINPSMDEGSRFPSFFEETGNKRLMDAEFFCEKNRKPRIRGK